MNSKIAIACALYCESKPLIQFYKLKPVHNFRGFPVFENEKIVLIKTGSGKVAAAAGISFILAKYPEIGLVFNFGICGGMKKQKIGALFLVDQISDNDTGRDFYPDILVKSSFPRANLVTISKLGAESRKFDLVDMEASAFFEAAGKFLPVDRIQVLKIVSDHREGTNLEGRGVEKMVEKQLSKIDSFLKRFNNLHSVVKFDSGELEFIDEVIRKYYLLRLRFFSFGINHWVCPGIYSQISNHARSFFRVKNESS
jgi:nucleoside phosphorylase